MENTRLLNVKSILRRNKLTHILISDSIDVEYLSGFRSSNAALLISSKENILFSDFRYKEAADKFCSKNPQWKFLQIKEQLFACISTALPKGSTVGIQSNYLTVDNYDDLKKSAPGIKYVHLSTEISHLFTSKYKNEFISMKKAAAIGDAALSNLIPLLKPGITELQVARKLEMFCLELGSEKPSFDTIALFGSRTALPHGKPGTQKLKKGDWILLDFGCTVNGFCSDMTRTMVVGKANDRQKLIYNTVLQAQIIAVKAAKAGLKAKDLDNVARSIIEQAGFGKAFGHALGHGVGLRIHEKPRVSFLSDEVLAEGSVITIEPGIYISGFGGVRIEDMVYLKKSNATVMTSSPKELIEL